MQQGSSPRLTRQAAPSTPASVLAAVLLLPSMLVVIVPYVILRTGFGYRVPDENVTTFRFFGLLPLAAGAFMCLWAFWDLLIHGGGKLPIFRLTQLPNGSETQVFRGVFRYTRNPVYAGVCLTLFGQAVYFVSGTLFFFTLLCFVALHLLVVVHEEPLYRALYQEAYSEYCRRVPRWKPEWDKVLAEENIGRDGLPR
ncbi:hypothetical protein PTSG_12356 [Salpingoeca rosetta]|uniref:Isoprenylcysteine carboxylmethyltransferase family protein n=1 Tax=Salpingoeca rosetta (strain ATCC 50818 / BSB-021) TaxID=946362 RepID=F2UB55_SALR5|nr:uncharacterized protein PTSG_12356 [Salpingoeca rosetta]EGD74068.1 hypothetical protein PTSG_12356 [Salpingoeca rosetta]|eukprot:XP_004993630.1 hypothetical protein PTSG_12356 [Salpingoeca rosetta]